MTIRPGDELLAEQDQSAPRPGSTVPAAPLIVTAGGVARPRSDALATEEPLEIRVHYRGSEHAVAVTMRTPGADFELAVGFLHGEGMVRTHAQVARVSYCASGPPDQAYNVVTVELSADAPFDPAPLERRSTVTSACGVCGKTSIESVEVRGLPVVGDGPVVAADLLLSLPAAMRAKQKIFDKTGGVHAAALFDESGSLIALREDVGRHNAVDKVVGARLLAEGLPATGTILLVSGRASFEIMQKAALAGIPIVASVSAPSSLAVSLAERCGITLCGFVRDTTFSVYTGADRIAIRP